MTHDMHPPPHMTHAVHTHDMHPPPHMTHAQEGDREGLTELGVSEGLGFRV
jgi:hypothetical protein